MELIQADTTKYFQLMKRNVEPNESNWITFQVKQDSLIYPQILWKETQYDH